MSKIVHAIVGCGRVAPNHFDAFSRIEGVEIGYAVDTVPERASDFAQRGLAKTGCADYASVLSDPDLTSVSLCVPHDLHAGMALDAVALGKHVLVEKPFVIDPQDGRKLSEAARAGGVIVMPVAQHRFEDIIAAIGEMVGSGELGKIALVRGHLECVRPIEYYSKSDWRGILAREGGSVLINQAYHVIELIRWLAGPTKHVSARMATIANPDAMETEDVLCANLVFDSGALGALTVCGAGGSQWSSYIELIGTNGEIAFDINFPNRIHRFQLKNKRAMKQWRARFKASEDVSGEAPPGVGYYGAAHRGQAEAFVKRIRGEPEERGADITHAQSVVETIREIYRSASQGGAQ